VTRNGDWPEDLKFVYDGYKKIETLDGSNSNAIIKKNVWSGETLLSENDGTSTYYALADANKNITEYLDSTGDVRAHYEYSPFGKITVADGDKADDFTYRFSSEYFDTDTKLVYYNYRYYSPKLGRWLSRDPIEEYGGYNLYGMVGNDPVNWWDYLGKNPNGLKGFNLESSLSKKDLALLNKFQERLSAREDLINSVGDGYASGDMKSLIIKGLQHIFERDRKFMEAMIMKHGKGGIPKE
jgi:RHS repeat-associated protein